MPLCQTLYKIALHYSQFCKYSKRLIWTLNGFFSSRWIFRFRGYCIDSWHWNSWSTSDIIREWFSAICHLISHLLFRSSNRLNFLNQCASLFFKVLTIFFFTEVLQKAYYRNVEQYQDVNSFDPIF